MPALDRQVVRVPVVPPSLAGLPPRSVPETKPTPLQKYYVLLSAPALVLGAVAITALEMGAAIGDPLVKGCVLVAAPLLAVANADAIVRIWRSAWAWMPVDRVKGVFRLTWLLVPVVGFVGIGVAFVAVFAA
jgi:hypothetical protein